MNVHKYEVTKNKPHYRDQVFTFQKQNSITFKHQKLLANQNKTNLTFFQKPTPKKNQKLIKNLDVKFRCV